MPPTLALLLWLILLLGLLSFDPAKDSRVSAALWVPLTWMFIVASRLPSQWLGGTTGTVASVLEDGNPLDRTIDLFLILLAIAILISRSFNWSRFFARNFVLLAFLTFALVSVLWSDFPFVSFKRWFRDFGQYLMILVVLSDAQPLEAVRTLLRRLSYLLIPLSIVLNKYYLGMSRQYDTWTGTFTLSGATTSKNMLGALCLVSGLFFLWDTVERWRDRKDRRTKRILMVNVAFMAMTLWLLNLAHSATSSVCLMIGCLVILAARTKTFKRHPGFFKGMIPACFCLFLILSLGFNLTGQLAGQVGRDSTLTDRTTIWRAVLSMDTNSLVGTGYESFWLGPRLQRVWQLAGHVNEAHNGYLDIYLNLGLIGLVLLIGFLIAGYRAIWKRTASFPALTSLGLAFWTILLFYNVTEAAFKGGLLWLTLLLGAISVTGNADQRVPAAATQNTPMNSRIPTIALQGSDFRR